MSTAVKRYQSHVHRQLSRLATWLPGDLLALGDVGLLERGGFRKQTSLAELGVELEVERGGVRPQVSCSSTSDLKLEAGGKLDTAAKLRARLSLSRGGTTVCELRDVEHLRIGNQAAVDQRIRELFDADRWQRSWVLVDQVWNAGLGTIIVAVENDTELSFSGEPKLDALVDADASLALTVERGEVVSEIGTTNFTPLYTARKLAWLGRRLDPIRSSFDVGGGEEEPAVAPSSIDDLLGSWA